MGGLALSETAIRHAAATRLGARGGHAERLGGELIVPARALADWAIEHYPLIERSRAEYDAAKER